MVRVRDVSALLGILVTHPVSRRPVRPLADEPMRSLPGDGLVADAKIRWNHAITIGQRVQVRDTFPMTPKAQDRFVVRVVEPDRTLVLGDDAGQMSWAFIVEPVDETSTRLSTRSRGTIDRLALGLMVRVFWHPLDFRMQQRQLLHLKRLVETA